MSLEEFKAMKAAAKGNKVDKKEDKAAAPVGYNDYLWAKLAK